MKKLLAITLTVWGLIASADEILEFWDVRDTTNQSTVDHLAWQEILDLYLIEHESGVNRFDYARLKASEVDKEKLTNYLLRITSLDPRVYSADVQMAYWINLYNALTVYVINNNYPVDSIKDIKSGLIDFGPWNLELITIQEQSLTLNDIEHRILRPIWRDPRIHYAVNCASIGCPNLSKVAYTSSNLEELLEKGASDYINHPRGVSIQDGELLVSSIYSWYEEDFEGTSEGVLRHLRQYATPELKAQIENFTSFDDDYDWSLNQP